MDVYGGWTIDQIKQALRDGNTIPDDVWEEFENSESYDETVWDDIE